VRESGKIGSMNELKTPVNRFQILDKQKGKINGPASTTFKYTEIYGIIHRKVIRELKTKKKKKKYISKGKKKIKNLKNFAEGDIYEKGKKNLNVCWETIFLNSSGLY